MAALRKLVRKPAVSTALSWLAARYIRFVWLTGRWRVDNGELLARYVADGTPFIGCFWHGRMLMIPNVWRFDARMNVLISHHRDGILISRTLAFLGIGTIAGSTSRGGGNALVAMVRALKRGEYVAITPDGPRGPRMRVAPGAAVAARLSGAPLVPLSFSAQRRIVTSSWDRMVVPLPFTRGIVRVGAPIEVARDADDAAIADARTELETSLIRLTNDLDAELGVETVHPAPVAAAADGAGLTAAGSPE